MYARGRGREDITRRRVRYTRAGLRIKLCRKRSRNPPFFLCLLRPRTQAPTVAYVSLLALRKRRRRQASESPISSFFLRRAAPHHAAKKKSPRSADELVLIRAPTHVAVIARALLSENYHPSGKSRCRNAFISHADDTGIKLEKSLRINQIAELALDALKESRLCFEPPISLIYFRSYSHDLAKTTLLTGIRNRLNATISFFTENEYNIPLLLFTQQEL